MEIIRIKKPGVEVMNLGLSKEWHNTLYRKYVMFKKHHRDSAMYFHVYKKNYPAVLGQHTCIFMFYIS